jgi:hypothetical protein
MLMVSQSSPEGWQMQTRIEGEAALLKEKKAD